VKKKAYNVDQLYGSGLIAYLLEELAYPTIVLFGSYAKGENHESSDIDIFVLADEKKHPDLTKYEKALGAKIQLFLHTREEFTQLKKTNKELINNVLNGIRLEGYLEVL